MEFLAISGEFDLITLHLSLSFVVFSLQIFHIIHSFLRLLIFLLPLQISDCYWPALVSESFTHHPHATQAIVRYQEAYTVLKKPR